MISGPPCCAGGITGYGSSASGIVFVGIAPGRNEVKAGRPFVGQSGKLLDAILQSVGIERSDIYCTNLICWYNDAPTADEIQVCNARLNQELQQLQPKLLIPMGVLACRTILGLTLAKARGAVISIPSLHCLAMPTYHPAAALRTGDNKDQQINIAYDIIRDFNKIPRILANQYDFRQPHYIVSDDPVSAQGVLDEVSRQGYACLDVETDYDKDYDKAHPFSDKLTCIGIGKSDEYSYVLTPNAFRGLNWPTNVKWTFHNGMFDTQKIARELGVWLPIGDDTMLQAYSLDERPKSLVSLLKLKVLAREYIGADFYEENEHKLDDTPALYSYNAKDVVYTHRLHQLLTQRQLDDDVTDVYQTILLPAAEMLARSQYRGIYIDMKAADQLKAKFIIEFWTLEEELRAEGAKLGFDQPTFLNSPKQLKDFIACMGIGIDSTNKAVLNELLESDEIIDDFPGIHSFLSKLLRYRTLYRLIKVYLLMVTDQIKYDGRVHPHPFLIGTVTGRLTYKDPAMQTLPKPKTVKELAVIRRIFAATSDDYILLEADYAQIEAWIAAYLSGDPVLLADLQSGNWHTNTTKDVFGVDPESVDEMTWKFYYDGGKHLNYGFLYGEGPEGLTRRPPIGMGCDLATSRIYHQRLNARYAHFIQWGKQLVKDTIDQGYLTTPFGRKRRFPIIVNDHQKRQIVNSAIQSPASDYTVTSAIRMDKVLREQLDTHLLFIEHDAVYYEINKRYFGAAVDIIKSEMEAPPLPNLPSIRVEMTIGQNLHDMQGLKYIDGVLHVEVSKDVWEEYKV